MYGHLYVRHDGTYEISEYNAEYNIERWTSEVDSDTVGQYMGLDDKNGNKIFENDIISFIRTRWKDDKCDDVEEYTDYAVVKYGEFNCSCCSGVYGWYFDNGDIRLVSQCVCAVQ